MSSFRPLASRARYLGPPPGSDPVATDRRRHHPRLAAIAFVVAVAAPGCSSGGVTSDINAEKALARLQQMLADTAKAAEPEVEPSWSAPSGPGECTSTSQFEGGSVTYSADLDLPKRGDGRAQLEAVRRYWDDHDYRIKNDRLDDDFAPSLAAERDGYGVIALAPSRAEVLRLEGETPCSAPASEDGPASHELPAI